MLRREFLSATAAAIFFPEVDSETSPAGSGSPWVRSAISPAPNEFPSLPKPPKGGFAILPKAKARRLAWTIDDGTSSRGLREYLDFLERREFKATFFVTSAYDSWKRNRKQLQYLLDAGQIQLANHSHTHPSFTRISSKAIEHELRACGHFIEDNFGVKAKPYFRPPYGRIDSRVRQVAREIGYTQAVMWNGSLGDSVPQRRKFILRMGQKWIQNRTVLIDHANDHTPNYVFRELSHIVHNRRLHTVTLDDVFSR